MTWGPSKWSMDLVQRRGPWTPSPCFVLTQTLLSIFDIEDFTGRENFHSLIIIINDLSWLSKGLLQLRMGLFSKMFGLYHQWERL